MLAQNQESFVRRGLDDGLAMGRASIIKLGA